MSHQQALRNSRVLRWRNTSRRPTRPLQLESLESRVVLSSLADLTVPMPAMPAAPTSGTDCIVVAPESPVLADPASAAGELAPTMPGAAAPGADAAVTASPTTLPVFGPLQPVEGTAGATPAGLPSGPPGGSGQPLLPPLITEFAAECQGDLWRFSGRVLDDKPVKDLTVYFGSLLQGHTTSVDRFGMFEILISLGAAPVGFVNAHTIDLDGLRSETVSILVG